MQLNERQKKFLRGLAHQLKPVVMIGQAGATDAVLQELETALDHHELVKISVRVGDRAQRKQQLERIVATTGAAAIQRVGNVAVLFRRNPEKPRVPLPG